MGNDLVSKFQGIIAAAAQAPSTGKVATQQARIDRRNGTLVILADISASMNELVSDGRRKIEVLRESVKIVMSNSNPKLFVFSDGVRAATSIPPPERGTDLYRALREIRKIDPGVTLLISDGLPDDEISALEEAKKFRGAIDIIFVGNEKDTKALDFMHRIAKAAGGTVCAQDIYSFSNTKQLANNISQRLLGKS